MAQQQIEIAGNLKFESVLSLEIIIQVNEHGSMKAGGILSKEAYKRCQTANMMWKNIMVKADSGVVLFYGILTKLEFRTDKDLRYIEVEGRTESLLLDLEPNNQAFQDISMTYGQVFDCLPAAGRKIRAGIFKKTNINTPLIQYDETDWEFIKRMAGRVHTVVVSGYSDSHAGVFMGTPKRRSEQSPFRLDTTQGFERTKLFMCQADDGRFKQPEYGFFERWKFPYAENLELGDWVTWKGLGAQVLRKKSTLVRGILETEYEAGPVIYYSPANTNCNYLKGMTLEGIVLSTDKEFMKVQLDIDAIKDGNEKKAYSFPYMPESGNIFYSMPEPGTRVCVYFPDGREEHGRVIHGKREYLEDYPDCDVKEFRSCKEKTLRMEPGSLELHSQGKHGSNRISLSGHKGIDIQSYKKICMKAKGDIHLDSSKFCTVTSEQYMLLSQSGTENYVEMSGNDMILSAEQFISSSCERTEKSTGKAKENREIVSCGVMLDFIAGGIPSGAKNEYERAVLGGLPTAVSISDNRNLRSALGKSIKR